MLVTDASSVQCQPKSFAEVGKSFELPCQVLGSNYDLYWYKGLTADTAPLLSLVDGISGGSEYQKRDFELTINGSLRIINSQLQHEGSYTLRVYFSNFEQDTSTTKLLIYIQPDPPCPLTDACGSTCTGCQLNVTTSGSLTCYVNGSRPMMDVDWIVTNQSGVSFTKEEQTHKEMGDKWYTEKTIEYTTPDCGADATFRCIASLPDFPFAPLLDTYYSTVRMNKGTVTNSDWQICYGISRSLLIYRNIFHAH
ncbi:putative carcinoembryonic antigen-related cell adhesion molecule 4 isoform X3 [Apostichopus japonicus]|uniref:Putative carcinoembryonic antigen-related cell adhesion molecule 4 isoform X3 n=1 Tax=Stichopus japonicus TaxID=307972 RepID=A0A2G8KRX9_STIJA|nr:putative carcinoembryonic antigen-related cell adhesion molecule 4 isoform X3 [Apostichopus japonicus]PIK53203.1 putative carcinoembryonic antigen-related cell adhesion molecule 4 isoform X3 [Apostichopus japonicus]